MVKMYCLRCGGGVRKEIKEKGLIGLEAESLKKTAFKEIESPKEVVRGKVRVAEAICPDCNAKMSKILERV